MTWEDDEFSAYEKSRARAIDNNKLASQRTQLLDKQQAHQWSALREAITKLCDRMNAKAGRQILRSVDPQTNHLEIRREEVSEKLEGLYVPDARTATFSCDLVPFVEKKYELSVRLVEGNDAAVWINMRTKEIERADDIAKSLLSAFLRSGIS
jgi:hypothetical protein